MKKWFAALVLGFSTIVSANGLQEDFQNQVSTMSADFVLYETKTGTVYDKKHAYIGSGKVQYQNHDFIIHYDKWMDEPSDRSLFANKGEVWVWENDTQESAMLADKQTPFVHPLMPFSNIDLLKKEFNFAYGNNTVILTPKKPDENETARIVFNFKRLNQDCKQGKPDCIHLLSVYMMDKYKNTSLYVFQSPQYNQNHKDFPKKLAQLQSLTN